MYEVELSQLTVVSIEISLVKYSYCSYEESTDKTLMSIYVGGSPVYNYKGSELYY